MAKAVDVFTPDFAKAAVSDEVARETMLDTFARKVATKRKGDESFALAAAYTTYAAFEADPTMTPTKFAKRTGADRASVYGYRRRGVLLVALGYDAKGPEYAALNVAGNPVNRAPLAGVLDGLGRDGMGTGPVVDEKGKTVPGDRVPVTAEDIAWAESLLFTEPDEKGARKVRSKDEVDVAVRESLGLPAPDVDPAEIAAQVARNVKQSAGLLARNLADATPETRAAIADDLAKIASVIEGWKRQAEVAEKRAAKKSA